MSSILAQLSLAHKQPSQTPMWPPDHGPSTPLSCYNIIWSNTVTWGIGVLALLGPSVVKCGGIHAFYPYSIHAVYSIYWWILNRYIPVSFGIMEIYDFVWTRHDNMSPSIRSWKMTIWHYSDAIMGMLVSQIIKSMKLPPMKQRIKNVT